MKKNAYVYNLVTAIQQKLAQHYKSTQSLSFLDVCTHCLGVITQS